MHPAVDRAIQQFEHRYGHRPQRIVRVPGRVNLIGEHVDYNDGLVLPMAIDRELVVAFTPATDVITVATEDQAPTATIALDGTVGPAAPAWSRYVGGVVTLVARQARLPHGWQAAIASDIPIGAGLSSSAALTVATASVLEDVCGMALDKPTLCRDAEHLAVGVPCGLMDPTACALGQAGHALLLDCRTAAITPVPLWDDALALTVIDSGIRRELAAGHYARRRAECEQAARGLGLTSLRDARSDMLDHAGLADVPARRARHVVSEIARTAEAVERVRAHDWAGFGALLVASHVSLRDDFEVSRPEIDSLVDALADGPVLGCRLTGAGFGGCVIALAAAADTEWINLAVADYQARWRYPARAWTVRAAGGATIHACPPSEWVDDRHGA